MLILLALGVVFWKFQPRSLLTTFLIWLNFLAANLVAYFIINWSAVNYYLRFLCLGVPAVLLLRYLIGLMRYRPTWMPAKDSRSALAGLVIAALLLPLLVYANLRVQASSRVALEEPVPLLVLVPVYGMWVVTNGGNAEAGIGVSNYVNPIFTPDEVSDPSMAFAVDMQEITIRGMVSPKGARPSDFRVYEGYNTEVFAPCSGDVVFVDKSHPEVEIGTEVEGLGNRVVLKCFEVFVTVANLRTILVQEGARVDVGQTVGYLGNNSQPSVPHLHIHATLNSYGPNGTPVPLLFEYIFATRNRIFIR
jgi:hypothetical protein